MSKSVVFILVQCIAFVCSASNLPGAITGVVLDIKGRPFAGATVTVESVGDRIEMAAELTTETDSDGKFELKNLELISYRVFAAKEEIGYPSPRFAVYNSNDSVATVTLTSESPNAYVVLKMAPKAAVLEGTLKDVLTGEVLKGALVMERVGMPQSQMGTSIGSNFKILVPADADVLLEVRVPGYATWYFPGTATISKRKPLRLKSGEVLQIPVSIQRVTQ
jgi:hypothetical protein